MNPYTRAAIFTFLAVTGLAVLVYSVKSHNYLLLTVAVLFTLVSADNIFCGFKKKSLN